MPQPPPTSIMRPIGVPPSRRATSRQGVLAVQLVVANASYSDFIRDQILLPPVVELCVTLDLVGMHIFVFCCVD